jgi:hypothetical protein
MSVTAEADVARQQRAATEARIRWALRIEILSILAKK